MALASGYAPPPGRRPAPAAPLVGLAAWLLVAPWLLGFGSMLIRNSAFVARRRPAEPGRT